MELDDVEASGLADFLQQFRRGVHNHGDAGRGISEFADPWDRLVRLDKPRGTGKEIETEGIRSH